MAITVMNRIWFRQDPPFDNQAFKAVMLALADNSDDFGYSFPSIETIRIKSSCKSQRTVQNKIAEAVKMGFLKKREREDCSNEYWFVLDNLPMIEPKRGKKELGPETYYKKKFDHQMHSKSEQDLFETTPASHDIDEKLPPASHDMHPRISRHAPPQQTTL